MAMLRWVVFFGILGLTLNVSFGFGIEKTVGPGLWSVIAVSKCDNPDSYTYDVTITRSKINRTHDVFDCEFRVEALIDDSYALRIEACKWVDGGCKPYMVWADDNFCSFIKEHGGDNFVKIMRAMELDPPDCPVPKAVYVVKQFLVNYDDFPENGLYGMYTAHLYLIKDGKDIACILYQIEFKEKEDD